ncbi:porin family protein [Mucilaginibacter sp. PAMB04168]|uniref:porin family protein n=1 Tax=Mucilaginibacter sp. PAMB04168 TaxID=3138567 RepID=UPI0031F619C2
MKKLLLAILAAGSFATASAQSKVTYGISSGVNFAKVGISATGSSLSISTSSLTTFSVGAFADIPVGSKNFSVQPGLYYTGKGFQLSEAGTSIKSKPFYLQVPVSLVYNVPFSGGKVFFGAGPYAAIGLNGKLEGTDGNAKESEDIKFGDNPATDFYKRTDFGATGMAGIGLTNGLLFKVNYDLGLSNVSPESDAKIKHRVVGLSVGYSF